MNRRRKLILAEHDRVLLKRRLGFARVGPAQPTIGFARAGNTTKNNGGVRIISV